MLSADYNGHMAITLSLGQMDVRFGDPAANLETATRMTEAAKRRGSDLILFPELWSTAYDLTRASRHASSLTSGLFTELSALARRTEMYILGSTLSFLDSPRRDEEHEGGLTARNSKRTSRSSSLRGLKSRIGNTLTVFAPDGRLLADYSKIHLFRLMNEHQYLTAGDKPVTVDFPFGRAGLAICYDLRFPELFRGYALAGAEMVFLPAEWPQPRLIHWQTLVRARAIENQMFVFACNRVGRDTSNVFFGHSMAVDPWGEVLAEGGEGEELVTLTADPSKVGKARRKIPVLTDRRPEIYR